MVPSLLLANRSKVIFRKFSLILAVFCSCQLVFYYTPVKVFQRFRLVQEATQAPLSVSSTPLGFLTSSNSPNLNTPSDNAADESSRFPEQLKYKMVPSGGGSGSGLMGESAGRSIQWWNTRKGDFTEFSYNYRPKKILIWNGYWESSAMWHKIFYEIIYSQCPQSNCILTAEKSELETADAVLFHLVDISKENYTFPDPLRRNPDQNWIGMTYEPPYILKYSGLNFTRLNGLFNRTMSYRSDSDVVVQHGAYLKISEAVGLPNYLSDWVGSHQAVQERNYAEGKRRLVGWFASSRGCKSQSRREKYIKELQSFIPVDIYGGCGPFKCGNQKTMRNPYKVEHDDCYLLLSVAYKFVLGFENSICDDYVTEKLYNHLKLNVVPVVFGGANYSEFAPPNSVIDATKYSPKQLSDLLIRLDKNDTAYNEYFRWKKDYYIESHDGVPLACDLCEQIHNPSWQSEKKVYERMDSWLEGGCRQGWYSGALGSIKS